MRKAIGLDPKGSIHLVISAMQEHRLTPFTQLPQPHIGGPCLVKSAGLTPAILLLSLVDLARLAPVD